MEAKKHTKKMSSPISKAYKEAKPNKPQKCHKCGKRGHYRRGCEAKTSHPKIGNPEPQEPSPTQPLVQETSNPRTKTQQPKVDSGPVYDKPIQPKKEVKIDVLRLTRLSVKCMKNIPLQLRNLLLSEQGLSPALIPSRFPENPAKN